MTYGIALTGSRIKNTRDAVQEVIRTDGEVPVIAVIEYPALNDRDGLPGEEVYEGPQPRARVFTWKRRGDRVLYGEQ